MSQTISVLIPVYNAECTVEAAVGSVLRQTYPNLDVVIVDDGSTDSTSEMLDAIARRDGRVRVVRSPRRGIIHALNMGLALCGGELVARMDADDISHPRRLELQRALMEARPEVSVCSSGVRMFPRAGLLGGLARYEEWLNSLVSPEEIERDMFVESPVAHPSVMMRRRELIEMGGYEERGWPEDYDLWLRYYLAGKRFTKVGSTLLFWRQADGRLTFTDSRYCVENFLRAKARYLSMKLAPLGRPVVLWGAGKTGRRLGKHLLREGLIFEAVIDIDSRKIGRTLRGRPIVGMEYLAADRNPFVIAAVSSHGARRLIREQLGEMGFAEGRDFICAA